MKIPDLSDLYGPGSVAGNAAGAIKRNPKKSYTLAILVAVGVVVILVLVV